MKLTKMSDVTTIIRGGGSVRKAGQGGLLALYDADGKQVDAWQNAIKAAATFLRYEPLDLPEPSPAASTTICLRAEPERPGSPTGKLQKFEVLRGRVKELADYFRLAGKCPERISLSPADFTYLLRSINARIRADARAVARAENERRKAEGVRGKRVKPVYVEAHAMTWAGIPLVEGPAYSKHRSVDLTPTPTTSALAP